MDVKWKSIKFVDKFLNKLIVDIFNNGSVWLYNSCVVGSLEFWVDYVKVVFFFILLCGFGVCFLVFEYMCIVEMVDVNFNIIID